MPLILALDQGTTSSRSILFRQNGDIVAVAQQEFPQYYPRPGWVEHDATEILNSQLQTIHEILKNPEVDPKQIIAAGITNQRETTVLWDRASGKPVAPAIVWQDRRTAELCEQLKQQGKEALFREKTGLLLDPYFSGTKLAWLLQQNPELKPRAERGELAFGTIDSWLAWNLTDRQQHVTDPSNASRTLLFNIHSCEWDAELLDILGIPSQVLPSIVDTSGVVGNLTAIPELSHIPIASMVGDQQAALFGQACFHPGMAKNTYGTGCFLLWQLGDQPILSENRLLTTIGWKIGNQVSYALEGSIFMGGAIVQWLRDGLGIISRSSEIEALAQTVTDTQGLYLVPAFTGLGAPYWDPHARGILVGITRATNKAHIARAALEAICYQTCDVLQAMQKDIGGNLSELRVDGGASNNNLMIQFQSDLLNVPVVRPPVLETTAWGAASLAGLAVGLWSSFDELEANWRADSHFQPQMDTELRSKHLHEWQRAVDRSRLWNQSEPAP